LSLRNRSTRREGNELTDDITGFYRHFLQCKACENFAEAQTYSRFKDFFDKLVGREHTTDHLDAYYEDLLVFLEAYCFIRYDDDLHNRFSAFQEYNFRFQYLEVAPRISFLMDVLVCYMRGELLISPWHRLHLGREKMIGRVSDLI
jgi:hypothetical protein